MVNGKSLLQTNIEYLQKFNITDVVVNVHHFPEQIVATIDENNGWGSNVLISDERNELLETGGGLLKAKQFLKRDFVTVNVDILTDLNLPSLISFHQQQNALITLAVAERQTTRFLLFDKQNQLCGWRNTDPFREKIVIEQDEYIQRAYSGIAAFSHEVLNIIPFTGKFSLIDVFLALAPTQKVCGFDHTGDKFIDVGKPGSVEEAEKLFKD